MKRHEGQIQGLPTLMAIYPTKLPRETVLDGLRAGGYAGPGILVYYRVKGTDQVVYADSGRIAAGQALDEAELSPQAQMETIVLIHPQDGHVNKLKETLEALGSAQVLYEGATIVEGRTTGETPEGGMEEEEVE
jgi:hypothetical protein